jgi:N-acetyl sugar amidotransferase
VQPTTRPGIVFNEDGICYACIYAEERKHVDWKERKQAALRIAEKAHKKADVYDCVIGVSGGKDSICQAITSRDELGLRCLLVNSEPEGITEIGKKNIENLKQLGFDVISIRPNPQVMKQLIRKDFFEYLNPVKVTEFSLWASTYIIADKFDIPLIIQGENPAVTLGVKRCLPANDDALMANEQDTLSSGWARYIGDGVSAKDLFLYHYDRGRLRHRGIRGLWLGNYIEDWSPGKNAFFAWQHGLTVRENFKPEDIGTYVAWAQLDSDLVQVNQMLKYYKFGFGQCTDYACYDIRDGLITREEGFELVKKYDGLCAERYIKKFCDYIEITEDEFWRVVSKFKLNDPWGRWKFD